MTYPKLCAGLSFLFAAFTCQSTFADESVLNFTGNSCSHSVIVTETGMADTTDLSQKIPIDKCGMIIENQSSYLATDLYCDNTNLNADGAALSLMQSTVDLNGKKIVFNNPPSVKTLNRGIFMTHDSKVYDGNKKGAVITGFYNGVDIYGDNNNLQEFSIENTINGISINGNNNKINHISAQNIGGVIDSQISMVMGEGKGFVVYGDYNKILNTTTKNIGFNGDNLAESVASMFGSAASISISGNHNIVDQHNAENIYLLTKANRNAQATASGIYIMGNYNSIENSYIKKINASGTRILEQGAQTGGIAYGILLSNTPYENGHNTAKCNTINDVFAKGQKLTNPELPSFEIIAESYGIAGYYSNQQIKNNLIEKVDAKADVIKNSAGIRLVDFDHVVFDNKVIYIGQRSLAIKIMSSESVYVRGISIDASYSHIEDNQISDVLGYGISVSPVGSHNMIRENKSYNNTFYNYYEANDASDNQNCRNDWISNNLENDNFYPPYCFK